MTINFSTNIDRYKQNIPTWYGPTTYPSVGDYVVTYPKGSGQGYPIQLEVISRTWLDKATLKIELYYSKSQLEMLKQNNLEL